MTEIPSRDMRDDTAGVLRRVEEGESLTVITNGCPVAQLVPVLRPRRAGMSRAEFVNAIREAQGRSRAP